MIAPIAGPSSAPGWLGYDEIQHAAFLFSTFFQDSLYFPRMRAYSEVASIVSPAFNVDAPEVTALITFLRERGTVVDGTFNIWQDRSRLLPDGTDPVFGPTIDWLSPLAQRDGELEIYERAGIPAPNVLQIATITSARVMKQEKDYGSVAVGKVADLAIVAGRPAERIPDLRKMETVVRAGRVYQSKALYEALGMRPR